MADIVLIHGAFHGGWCWRDGAARLRAQGHRVFAPSLTGLGDRAHLLSPAVNLDTHIADICGVIEAEELNDVVLVGHSYGGMPITGAADRMAERIGALVYLDAFTPSDGESALAIRAAAGGQAALTINPPADGPGLPVPSASAFGLTGDIEAWVQRRMTPHPYATFDQPIGLSGAWLSVPRKIYVRKNKYPAPYFDQYYERWKDDPDWIAYNLDAIHNLMMTDPEWFVGLIMQDALPDAATRIANR